MLHRIREAFADLAQGFEGPVEVDETYVGGLERNAGRGAGGKVAVVGAKDRETNRVAAKVVETTDRVTLQGFVADRTAPGTKVYTDGTSVYDGPYQTARPLSTRR